MRRLSVAAGLGSGRARAARAGGRGAHVHLEHASVATVASLAEQHAQLRVEERVAMGVGQRALLAGGALAQRRHRTQRLRPARGARRG